MTTPNGYLIKYDSTNHPKKIIHVSDIYINKSTFLQLKKDISNPEVRFTCSCTEKQISLSLSDNGYLVWKHNEHTVGCYNQYYQMIHEMSDTQKGALLRGQTLNLHLSLSRDTPQTLSIIDNECILRIPQFGNMDLSTFIGLTNVIAFSQLASEPVASPDERNGFYIHLQHKLRFQLGTCKLRDLNGNYFSINNSTFLTEHAETGKLYFFYGLVIEQKTIRQYVHLKCTFLNTEVTITIPLTLWDQNSNFAEVIGDEHRLLWLAGFVRVVERTRYSKGDYDSYTHSYYSGKKQKVQEFTLKHGVLFHTNRYGLICFSENEAKEGTYAMDKGYGLLKPIFPFCRPSETSPRYSASLIARTSQHVTFDHFIGRI